MTFPIKLNPSDEAARLLESFLRQGQKLKADIANFLTPHDRFHDTDFKTLTKNANSGIESIAVQNEAALIALREEKAAAETNKRRFTIDHQIERSPNNPDIFKTISFLLICVLIGGFAGGAILVADGVMDLPMGFAVGFSIAALNLIWGMLIGFFPARYMGYRLYSLNPKPIDLYFRIAAWFGGVTGLAGLLGLYYSGGRVRITGSAKDIFDFQTVSFFAVFQDYYAIALIVLGIAGGILSIYKGRNGISDPIVGYSDHCQMVEKTINPAGETIHDNSVYALQEVYGPIREKFKTYTDERKVITDEARETLLEINERVNEYSSEIGAEISELKALQDSDQKYRQAVTDRKVKKAFINFKDLDNLKIDPIPTSSLDKLIAPPTGPDPATLLTSLDTTFEMALANINHAYVKFLINTP
ncbi:MAG: hypothetical protein JKY84_02445 [Emcibacteraceae bacterium]|nr:hypothetical protein [Emcibacteraceae bacterium]